MYYELEIYDNKVPEKALDTGMEKALHDGVLKKLAIVQNAKHALKSIFGEGEPTYSIAMGKEVITSLQVVNANLVATPNPLMPVVTSRQLIQSGLRLEVTGHLYEPYKDYDNAALLFLWFQEMETYNTEIKTQMANQEKIKADIAQIDPSKQGTTQVNRKQSGLELNKNLVSRLASAGGNKDKMKAALGSEKNNGLRSVVMRVLNDDGFVFRVYYLPRAYLARYVESYDMEKDTGEFSMLIVQDTTTGETGEINGKDNDAGLSAWMNKASRGVAKAKAYVDGTAAAVKTAAAVANSVAGISMMASNGKDTDTNKILKRVASGLDAGANGVAHVGDGLGAVGSMGKGGVTQESMNQLIKATDSIAQDERDIATEATHPEILEEEERKKMEQDAKEAAELEFRVDELEQEADKDADEKAEDERRSSECQDDELEHSVNRQLKEENKKKEQEKAMLKQETATIEQEAADQLRKEELKKDELKREHQENQEHQGTLIKKGIIKK